MEKGKLRPLTRIPGSIASYAVAYLKHERKRLARSTIKAHTRRLGHFTIWAYGYQDILSPFEITKIDLELYQEHLAGKNLSERNRREHLRTLAAFFSWLHEQGYILDNPTPLKLRRASPSTQNRKERHP